MAKPAAQRITDTLAFLQNTGIVTLAERTPAYQLAQDYMNVAFPNTALPAYTQFSDSLSLGFHLASDPNDNRKMVRALYLLWKAMNHYDNQFVIPVQNVAQINQGTVQRMLINYIRKARCLYDRVHGGDAGATHVLTQVFRANPLQFLADNNVFVAGSTALDTAQGPQNIQSARFEYRPGRDRFEFGVTQPIGNGAVRVDVESVAAFHWTDPRYLPSPPPHDINTANFSHITGIQLSGTHPMVTTQFTGCSFCMGEHQDHMYCAHITPYAQSNPNNTDGLTLARRVMATGAFKNAGNVPVRLFGRNLGSPPHTNGYDIQGGGGADTYMTIVGFRGGTTYQIYSQTTQNKVIKNVLMIF